MKKRIKGFMACALSAACMVTACSSPAQPIDSKTETAASDTSAAVTAGETGESGSGKSETGKTGNDESGARPKLTYFVEALGNSNIQSYNENVMYQEVMKILNIDVEFQHSTKGQFNEQLGVMIASSDLPDIIEGFKYSKGPEAAIEDGLILPLNDLVDQYAPDFKALLESDPEIKRQVVTDDGTIWAIPCLQPKPEPAWRGLSIRKDLLDKAGLEVPATLGELEDAMRKFKEMGVTYPFSMKIDYTTNNAPYNSDGCLVAAYGIGPSWYKDLETGEVKFGPMQDSFKDFLTMANRWYADGLLDPEFNTRKSDETDPLIVNGDIAVFANGYGPTLNCQNNGAAVNSEFQLEQFPNLPINKGETVQMRNADPMNKGNDTVISAGCENPEAAMTFLNFGFTEEGAMMYNYGLEGISYEMVDGKPQFTARMTDGSEGAWPQIREKYKKHTGPYNRDWEAFPISDFERHCMEVWNQPGTDLIVPKKMTRTADENGVYEPIMTDINVFLDENVTAFITGNRSLSEFDQFRDELKALKIEEALEIQRAAYKRYQER